MRRNLLVVLFFIVIFSAYTADTNISIVWWNVANFFDTIDDPKKNDTVVNKQDYQEKISLVSGVIKDLDGDIIGLTEVENIAVLKLLASETGYQYYYLIEGNDPRGIDIAMMSRFEAVYYRSNKDLAVPYSVNYNYKFSRDCPEAKFVINGVEFFVVLAHLKSKYGKDQYDEEKRVAQAKGIITIIGNIYNYDPKKKPPVIVLGDFNTGRETEPLNILEKSGLRIINYDYPLREVYTYIYQGTKEDIDYMMVNEHFVKSFKIKNFKAFHNRYISKASDHFPLKLEVVLKK